MIRYYFIMKTEELIKTFQALDVHKRNVEVQFITPDCKILDIDKVSLLSSISATNYTPKLTFYVYLKEKQRDNQDTQGMTEKTTPCQNVPKNPEREKQLTVLRENIDCTTEVLPKRFG